MRVEPGLASVGRLELDNEPVHVVPSYRMPVICLLIMSVAS